MAEIFVLNPEDEKGLHPYALRRFNDWKADVLREVPQLEQLDMDKVNVDLNAYLNDGEKARAIKYRADIVEWIGKCLDVGDGYSPYPYSTWVIRPMSELKRLVKIAYERKAEKARQEQTKKEEEERWEIAYKALKPPLRDAKMFLNPKEYQEFEKSVLGAVDAYVAKDESYALDIRATSYLLWCSRIKNRREQLQRKIAAEHKSWEFNRILSQEITKLKSTLHPKRQNREDYFQRHIVDLRYSGQSFVHLLLPDEKQSLDADINRIARRKLEKLVPVFFYRFVDWECHTFCFLLPSADYSFERVPCLDFSFDIFAVVETKVWLKSGQKGFGGYIFTFPQIEHKCDPYASFFAGLNEPEFLGYHYLLLTPSDLGCTFWRSIPLVLIQGLMNGELESAVTTISEASEAGTTYTIKGFEEQVTIPESFAGYLKEIGGIEQMVSIGILSKKVADILKRRLGQSEAKQKIKLLQNEESVGYEDKDLVSSLTRLGISLKDTETLLPVIPKNLPLPEAIKFALRKHMKSYTNAQRES